MNLFATLKDQLVAALETLQKDGALPDGLTFDAIEISPTRDASHGELATNAAMVLAGKAKMKPRDIAEKLVPLLLKINGVTKAEIAGPGFINLSFVPSFWHQLVPAILKEGTHYGDSKVGAKQKVNVEYVSANPTGPMHIGHARGAVVGDVTARLLSKAGFDVCKEYYINDAGAQVDKLAESLYLRYREANGENIGEIPEGLYPGDYLKDAGQALVKQQGKALMDAPRETWFPLVRAFGIEAMLGLIKHDLKDMGIEHHVFSSEKAIADAGLIDAAVKTLEAKGLAYMGTLEPPKGKAPDDWEPVELLLFKSTQFGDDSDRPLKKSSGAWTYIAPDIAYHFDKLKRGFKHMILVVGADHVGYVKRLKAAVAALSDNEADLDVKLCQLVHLYQGGEPFKMSKRAGTFITVREVLDAVGRDILRFIMLTRKNDMPLDFDIEKVKEQSKDNPVFYVQYAHARAHSLMRLAKDELPQALAVVEKGDMSVLAKLTHPAEIALMKQMADWPRMIEGAALSHEPHRVVFTLQELAASFHGLWALGNDDLSLRFIVKDDIEVSAARLMLAKTVATVIASGLEVVGVTPKEEMR